MNRRLFPPVDLWLVSLDQADAVSTQDLAHAEDRARYQRIVVPRRKRQFAFRRRALRYVLSRYLPSYELDHQASGKPYVRSAHRPGLQFSTSSSRDICAICVGGSDTGIDVEAHPAAVDVAGIVTEFLPAVPGGDAPATCPPDEADAAPALRAVRQHVAMMTWCRLEAHTKLHGRTLHQVLFDKRASLSDAFGDGHHVVAVVNLDYVCVIAQERPFRIARIHQIDFARIARANG
jgi:phosphopantetheinyl transferase